MKSSEFAATINNDDSVHFMAHFSNIHHGGTYIGACLSGLVLLPRLPACFAGSALLPRLPACPAGLMLLLPKLACCPNPLQTRGSAWHTRSMQPPAT